jgi:hypothetical protein
LVEIPSGIRGISVTTPTGSRARVVGSKTQSRSSGVITKGPKLVASLFPLASRRQKWRDKSEWRGARGEGRGAAANIRRRVAEAPLGVLIPPFFRGARSRPSGVVIDDVGDIGDVGIGSTNSSGGCRERTGKLD